MFKNTASQSIELFAFDTTTGAPKTGDAANMVFYVTKDFGTVTAIAANSGVPTEMDATNAKGLYKIALSQTETNADHLTFSGKSSTSNISVVAKGIDTYPANFSTLSVDGSGRVDVAKVGGTSQTAGDIFARIGAPAGASVSADIAAVKVDTAAVKVQTDKLTFTVANQIDANVLDWKSSTAPAMTGDAFARLGAPAGASIAADIAEIEVETDDIAAIKAKTDNLPSDPADESLIIAATDAIMGRVGAPVGASISADIAAAKAVDDAIKAKTDSITATVTGQIDVNIKSVNDVTVNGTGVSGDPWGP